MKRTTNRPCSLIPAALLAATMGWWGFFCPEFTLTPDTVKIIETTEQDTGTLTEYGARLYFSLLKADKKDLHIKCKLWEDLLRLKNKE